MTMASKTTTSYRQDTTFRSIHVTGSYGEWAELLWRPSGRVIIISDYGNWSYYWGHRGSKSTAAFLVELDIHYMGKKMLGAELEEFSLDSTFKRICEGILSARYSGDLSKDNARNEWELAQELDEGDISFEGWGLSSEFFREDWYEYSCKEMVSEWTNFWDRLWVPLILPELNKELNREQADIVRDAIEKATGVLPAEVV